jgi:hypothetical protein
MNARPPMKRIVLRIKGRTMNNTSWTFSDLNPL